jgi:outer membrane cobalamin receptor
VGFSEFATNGHRHNAAYEATEFLAKLAVSADEGALLTFTAGGQSSRSGRPGPLPAEDYADRSLSQQLLGTADASSLVDAGESLRGYVQGEAKIGGLKVRVSFDSWDDDSRQDWYNFSSEHITQNSSMVTTKPELDVSFSHLLREDMTVLGGCSGEYDEVSFRTIEENIATSALTETERTDYRGTGALWGQVEFDSQPWSVLAGVRYDEPSDFDGKATGRLIGAWTDETGLRVEASVGSAYRAPSLNDLNWPADPYTEGNPNLEPENAREADLSVRWSRGGTSGTHIRATGFSKQVDGMIVWGPDATGIWRPENLNDVEINGAEIAADVPIPGGLRARVGYTFLDAQETGPRVTHVDYMAAEPNTFQESTRDLAYTPTHKVDAALEWSLQTAAGQVRLGITASWISEVIQYYETWEETVPFTEYDVTYPTKELAAHTLVGLNASWSWRGGEAFLRLNNLLDEEYATQFGYTLEDGDYPAPGRSVSAGARIRF